MKRTLNIFFLIVMAIFGLIILYSCSSREVNTVILKKEYSFDSIQNILVLIIPSGKENLDRTFSRVLQIDLQSRGYKVTDANKCLNENSDVVNAGTFREIVESLLKKKYLPPSELVVIARPQWERIYLNNDKIEKAKSGEHEVFERRLSTYMLSNYIAFYDKDIPDPIFSFTAIDTSHIYSENVDGFLIFPEYPWMIAARQITRELAEIPICKVANSDEATYQFDVELWVDKSYREAFPDTWKDRLALRMIITNDILKSQFDIELSIKGFKEWNSEFQSTLKETLIKLVSENPTDQKYFHIGITLDKKLKTNWLSKSAIGYAYLLSEFAVITAQPSFPEIGQYWNPVEEAITIAHEVGHLFGAIHVPDENSIMYPTSGYLSYEFDEVNYDIIQETKAKFFNAEKTERTHNYNQVLIDLRNTKEKNSLQVIPAIANSLFGVLPDVFKDSTETDQFYLLLNEIIPDSILVYAVVGYLAYKLNNLDVAKEIFLHVIDKDPDFAEAHWYLAEIYKELGRENNAKEHLKIANRYKKYWIIDDEI